jgi:hypothetical protein
MKAGMLFDYDVWYYNKEKGTFTFIHNKNQCEKELILGSSEMFIFFFRDA